MMVGRRVPVVLCLLLLLVLLVPSGVDARQVVPAAGSVALRVNFQPTTAAVPSGYLRDSGEAFGLRGGADQSAGLTYGWIDPASGAPLDLVGNGRERQLVADQRLDTFMKTDHVTLDGTTAAGAWEMALPNDAYTVTVAVGDAASTNGTHDIRVEGQVVIAGFQPTPADLFAIVTRTVNVTDGRLTVDAPNGTNTKIDYLTIDTAPAAATRPSVTGTIPADGAAGVPRDTPVALNVSLPNVGSGVDASTVRPDTVRLIRASDGIAVPANRNTSGGGDEIVIQPTGLLDPGTRYRVDVTDGVMDLSGAAFLPYSSAFTTGTGYAGGGTFTGSFDKVPLPNATGRPFTSLVVGPDGKLYAGTLNGEIVRFPLRSDGTTGTPQVIRSLQQANGGPRMLIGLAFDPASTATRLILWTTHSYLALSNGPDWTGRITRMSGPDLGTVQDYVVGLPRSVRDHLTNSLAFGPDGALYVTQGSNSAMGAPDAAWGYRPERLLSAAVLRVDVARITAPPLDVRTEGRGASDYRPFAAGAPVTIYASGLRNAYDLVWHSNGELYVPTNGSAAGGNTPGTPATLPASCRSRIDDAARGDYTAPRVPALTNVPVSQHDYLFRVVRGGYYGHPDPARCEWTLNGGDPTAAVDRAEVAQYPDGTRPDRNWRGYAFDFNANRSPDGIIEYRSRTAFGGTLKGRLLVARYSAGDDIMVLTPGGTDHDIAAWQTHIPGLTGFVDPLDLAEGAAGNLYVTELGAQRITLLRPRPLSPVPAFTRIIWSQRAAAPVGLEEAQGEMVDRRIYVFGGYAPCCVPLTRSSVYDPGTDTWRAIRSLPVGLTHAGNTTDGRFIYMAGGFVPDPSAPFGRTIGSKAVYRYDPVVDTYARLADLPRKRSAGGLEVLGRTLHYFGGLTYGGTASVGDHWALDLDDPAAVWVPRAPLPDPRNHLGSAVVGGRVYAIGGQHGLAQGLTTLRDVHMYDPATDTWQARASLPAARSHIAASTFVMGGRIIVAGGETAHGTGITDMNAYDPGTNRWVALTSLPGTRISPVARDIGGRIYVITGSYQRTTYRGVPD